MACAASLHPLSSSSRALFPTLCRRSTFPAIFHRLRGFSSTSPLVSTVNRLIPVRALARTDFSVKEDEVASECIAADVEFQTPLRIVEYPDPILRAKNKRIDSFDDHLKNLVDEMFDVMYKTDGIGLSAPQVGINVQLMVFNPVVECGEGEEIVLVNPRVTRYSQKTRPFNEGCLSFPGIYADVVRPETVKIDAQDIKGARFTVSLSGLPARVFQHEFDHLQIRISYGHPTIEEAPRTMVVVYLLIMWEGILFFDRMSDGVLETICAQLQALEKKYADRTGLSSPERVETRRRMKDATGFGKSQLV